MELIQIHFTVPALLFMFCCSDFIFRFGLITLFCVCFWFVCWVGFCFVFASFFIVVVLFVLFFVAFFLLLLLFCCLFFFFFFFFFFCFDVCSGVFHINRIDSTRLFLIDVVLVMFLFFCSPLDIK